MRWIASLALGLSLTACTHPPAKPPALALPDTQVQTQSGERVSLRPATAGRVVVLDLWATWCPPCVENIPRLVRLAEVSKDTDLLIVGVDVGETDFAAVERFAQALKVNYPLYYDPEFTFADEVGSSKVPTVLILDRSGKVVHRSSELDAKTLQVVQEQLNQ
jgi:thiol-disulfide isomerase/thioredoxin